MPETSNKELNQAAEEQPTIPKGPEYDPVRGHQAENAQTFLPDMTAPGAGTPDGPNDDGSAGGPAFTSIAPGTVAANTPKE